MPSNPINPTNPIGPTHPISPDEPLNTAAWIPAKHAQVKVYGWLMCQKLGLSEIDLALVYFDIVGEGETLLNPHAKLSQAERQEQVEALATRLDDA